MKEIFVYISGVMKRVTALKGSLFIRKKYLVKNTKKQKCHSLIPFFFLLIYYLNIFYYSKVQHVTFHTLKAQHLILNIKAQKKHARGFYFLI